MDLHKHLVGAWLELKHLPEQSRLVHLLHLPGYKLLHLLHMQILTLSRTRV